MNQWKADWQRFVKMCLDCPDETALQAMLDLFLTPEEKVDIARRFSIVRELIRDQKTQRDIAKSLDVSIAKITRGSNELKRIDNKWIDYLNVLFDKK